MTTRTTEGFKHNKDAVFPVILSLVAFILSLAGWWLAWMAGLAVFVVWLILLCFMDYIPHVQHVLLVTIVASCIACVAEIFLAANVNEAASCGNEEEDCKHLSPPLKMIIAAIAAILWGIIAYMTYQRYRAKIVDLPV